MPILGHKALFCGGHFKVPQPCYVLGGMEAGNPILAQNWPKNSNFWRKTQFFLALVVSSRLLNRILQVLDSLEHVLRGLESKKWVYQGYVSAAPPIFSKQFFWGFGAVCQAPQLGWSVRGRPTLCVPCVAG